MSRYLESNPLETVIDIDDDGDQPPNKFVSLASSEVSTEAQHAVLQIEEKNVEQHLPRFIRTLLDLRGPEILSLKCRARLI